MGKKKIVNASEIVKRANLYYWNANNMTLIGQCDYPEDLMHMDDAFKHIDDFIKEHQLTSYYMKTCGPYKDGVYTFDYGSPSNFFFLKPLTHV